MARSIAVEVVFSLTVALLIAAAVWLNKRFPARRIPIGIGLLLIGLLMLVPASLETLSLLRDGQLWGTESFLAFLGLLLSVTALIALGMADAERQREKKKASEKQ